MTGGRVSELLLTLLTEALGTALAALAVALIRRWRHTAATA